MVLAPTVLALSLVFLTTGAASPAVSIDDTSREAFERSAAGDIAGARLLLEEAYENSRSPILLYVRATIELEAKNCAGAIEYFELFVQTHPAAEDRAEAERQLDYCKEVVGPSPAAEVLPPPAPEPVAADEGEPGPQRQRSKPDAVSVALLGGGAALVLGGSGMVIAAANARGAGSAPSSTEGAYGTRVRRLSAVYYTGLAVLSVGAVLAIAGGIRWGVLRRRSVSAQRPRLDFGTGGVACAF